MKRLSKPRRVLIQELLELQQQFDALKEASERNIPEVPQTENQLNLQNPQFNQQLNFKDSNILSLDSHYNYIAFNDLHASEIKKMFSVDIKTGMNFLDCIPDPTLRKDAKQHIDRALSGEFYTQEINLSEYSLFYEIKWIPITENKTVTGIIVLARDITEQKLTTEAVQKNKERYRTTLDNLLEGCHLLDFDLRYLYLNKAAEIQNRRPSGELIGNRYVDMWPGVEETMLFGMIKQALVERVANHFENEFRFPDGNKGWYDLSIQPVPEGVFILSVDITNRKLSEDQLLESVSSLKESQHIAHMGSFLFDIISGTWTCSEELDELYGIDSAFERSLAGWRNLIHPDDRIMVGEYLANEVIGRNQKFDKEFRIIRPVDQAMRWIWGLGKLERDDSGRAIKLIGTSMDITERKQAEESSIKSKQLLSETELLGKVGGWEFNVDTLVQTWTDEVYRIHEVDPDFNPNVNNGIEFYTPESKPIIEAAVQRAIEFSEPFDLELDIITAKGNLRRVHAIGNPEMEQRRVYGFFQDITERKNAEEALEIKEQKYQTLFESADDAILLFFDGTWVDCNEAALKVFGCTREQIIGAHPSRFSPPMQPDGLSSEEESFRIINLAFAGEPQFFEWEHIRLDGTHFAAEVKLKRLDLGGKPYMQAIVRDVSKRKHSEQALNLVKSSLEAASDALYWMTPDSSIVNVNEAACRLLGYTREELLQLTVPDVDAHYNTGLWIPHFNELRKLGTLTFESEQRTKDGRLIPVEIVANYVRFGEEEFNCAFARDITKRKQAEEELRERENKLSTIFNLLPVGISILDQNQKIVYENTALQNILGITKEGLERGDYRKRKYLRSDGTPKPVEEFASERLLSEKTAQYNCITGIVKEDGNTLWTNVSAVPVEFSDWKIVIVTADITEIKQAEESLKASNSYNRRLIEASIDPLVTIGQDGKISDVNTSTEKVTGYNRMELIGSDFSEYFTDPEKARSGYQLVFANGSVQDYPLEIRNRNGHITSVLYNATTYKNDNGVVAGVFAAARDITERKLSEEQSRKNSKKYQQLVDSISDIFFSTDKDIRYTYWNKASEKLTGISAENAIGKTLMDVFPDNAARQHMKEICLQVIYSQKPQHQIVYFPGDEYLVHEISAYPHEDGVSVFVKDITESKLAEEALKKSEYEFRLLAEAMPQIVWITRADGWNTYFNQKWVDYTGLTLEESYGHGWNKPFHPDDQQRAWDAWSNAVNNNGIYLIEARLRRADGVYQWWLIRGVPVLDADGNILRWFGTCTSIHELKLADELIRINIERLQNLHITDQAILLAIESPEEVVQTAIQHMRILLDCQRTSVGIFDLKNNTIKIFAADVDGRSIVKMGSIHGEEISSLVDILRQNKIEVVENTSIPSSPDYIEKIIETEGIQSFINVALVSEMEMYGVLNAGWENPKTITPEEIEIASEVANQVTIAIEKASLLKETKRYAKELKQRVSERTVQLENANKELEIGRAHV